ncbi:signal peptidase II [Granulicatella sp. zg-ZJ]|uniref:signal peptidase II n=1 Tax=Granulicatella sp. zg-ZJ TaxID=2678504 RepID=UPI0013D39C97|nr:signal peptidase II [Granulicatella sp. zg-ZJ]NEW63139.1 signal peptidase II [Granulicatella sp. zg-ZJ]
MIGYYIGILLLIGLDQVVKYWIVQTFPLHTGQTLIDGVVSLYHIQNKGAAWGILSGNMLFFTIMTIVVLVGLMYWIHRQKRGRLEKMIYMFIFAGAIGNFIDRLRLGYVVDMIKVDFIDFPIFNVADICLTFGAVLLILYMVLDSRKG